MIGPLIIPSFIAGVLTFLAPCTLPLVPGYLGFISGVSLDDIGNPETAAKVRRKVFLNGLFYVIGFSLVFVLLGSLIGLVGGTFFAQSRLLLSRIGGGFVVLFGLFMVQSALVYYESRWPAYASFRKRSGSWPVFAQWYWATEWMTREHRLPATKWIKPGNPISSTIFGAAFAVGWTPCVGPVLGAILTLAATGASVAQGSLLLAVFSAGLAVPFLVLAGGIGYFSQRMQKINQILPIISAIGGLFIVFLGILVLTNSLGIWVSWFFRVFDFVNYEALLDHL